MIKVDESDPVGELEPSFPYKDITISRGVDMKNYYELQSEIGRGKFGTVFKCREKATGLMLAAKFVGIVHKQDRRNVEREVEIMCELQHPRLIQLYDAFESNNAMCFILELVEGGELFERVIGDDFVLTEKAVTIFMRQICEGVQFIHSKNILHLDLKPENILCLTKTGNRIKIIDFGLARKFNPDNKLQVLFGTPEFVAPEVVNFDAIGFGTDMWSVGVICYVLLSGLSPFMGETDVETMANVTIAQYDFDDEAFDSISNDAKDFIKKLLVKDHKSRPTATDCLSHRWLQRKKIPKKMVRKGSSKKLAKPTEDRTIPAVVSSDREVAMSLDASKENLKELYSKSRSQSPSEIVVTASPSLAHLRIQKDSKPFQTGNGVGSNAATCSTSARETPTAMMETAVLPRPISEGTFDRDNAGESQSTTSDLIPTVKHPQSTTSDLIPSVKHPQSKTSDLIPTVKHPQPTTSDLIPTLKHPQPTTFVPLPNAPKHQQLSSGPQPTLEPQTIYSGPQQVQDSDEPDARRNAGAASAAVDISRPSNDVCGQRTTTWSQTILTTNTVNNYRRASDVSYMFSSFRNATTTMSSKFLGSDLQGLSERLQDLQTMFENSAADRQVEVDDGTSGNLHKLLLNRQHLTAAVADRKPKFKFVNRDVPVGSPPPASNLMYYMTSSTCRSAPHSKRTSPEHESTSAKEMLLKLFYGDKTAESKLSTA